ncbi:MAG: hypothetical protein IM552_00835 [Chitinophagaceae bacterium]|nr:hypothetical protein [Chitinophagaceae bacterium]
MFISATVVEVGVTLLDEQIASLKAAELKFGDDLPDDYDLNDIGVFESVRSAFCDARTENPGWIGYQEIYWWGKPFRWFMSILEHHVRSHQELPPAQRMDLERTISEYRKRSANLRFVDGCYVEVRLS